MLKTIAPLSLLVIYGLTGCATNSEMPVASASSLTPSSSRSTSDTQRIAELERQLVERQRHCLEDKRRQDLALKENQKQSEELQKKLNALLAIDRELRRRGKNN